ncbi:hypothetical protein ACIRD6_36375 [Streptomyces sp. NPDC102473]|uniref:hypothetical protein n=1 Tax=Streptomyces sp. NPDC102473 TaxID=3366180 RepID=UPI00380E8A12
MRTTTVAITAGILLATLTACATEPKPDATASPTAAATQATEYDAADCRALLESNYTADASRDVSAEPECAHLPNDQYGDLVGSVLAGHKDDILTQAENEIMWDNAWEQTPVAQQQVVCDRVAAEGVDTVAKGMGDTSEWKAADLLQYFHDEKC